MKNKISKFKQVVLEYLTEQVNPNLSSATGCADPCALNYQPPVVLKYIGPVDNNVTEDDLSNESNYTIENWNGNNGEPFIVSCDGSIYGNITGEGYWENIWMIAGLPITLEPIFAAAIALMNPLTLVPMILGAVFGSGTNENIVGFGDVGNTLLALSGLSGPELNDFCYNPNSTQGNIPGMSAVLNITEPTFYSDLPTGDVIITGPQQTQALLANQQNYEGQTSGQTINITCCNYDKDYMRLLGMGPGVPTTSGIDDKPANLDLEPTLGVSSCEDYCSNGGWELVPNIDIISEQQMGPEIGINACASESECLQGCIANGAQNPQLWCTGGQEQSLQQTNPLKQRMKKLAGIKEQEEIEPIGGETKSPNEFAYFDFKSWAYEVGTKELFRETKFKGPKGDIEYTLEEATEMGAGIMFFVLTQIWTLWTKETDNDQFGRIKDENINDFGKALYKMMKEDGKGFFFKGDERGAKVGDDAEYLKQRYGVEMNENILKEAFKKRAGIIK